MFTHIPSITKPGLNRANKDRKQTILIMAGPNNSAKSKKSTTKLPDPLKISSRRASSKYKRKVRVIDFIKGLKITISSISDSMCVLTLLEPTLPLNIIMAHNISTSFLTTKITSRSKEKEAERVLLKSTFSTNSMDKWTTVWMQSRSQKEMLQKCQQTSLIKGHLLLTIITTTAPTWSYQVTIIQTGRVR